MSILASLTRGPNGQHSIPSFVAKLRRARVRRPPLWRALVHGTALGIAAFAVSVVVKVLDGNVHEVQAQRVYRSSQLSPVRQARLIASARIRTVVNLRGCCADFAWYQAECAVSHNAGVAQEDVFLSATRLPAPSEVRQLLAVLLHTEYPILLHCRQGVDRTGLAAVMVQLLCDGVSLPEALQQLSVRYGYVPCNGTQKMRRFFGLYEQWLAAHEINHSPVLFRHWAEREYCPGACRAEYEPVDIEKWQRPWPVGQSGTLSLCVHNRALEPWQFRSGSKHAVYARYSLRAADGRMVLQEKAGQFNHRVSPGEEVVLQVGVPALPAGTYHLWLDMIDADDNAFCQFGGEPFTATIQVGP